MTHSALQELLGVYALDALEHDEAEVVEAHLDTCPRCADEVRGHREVAAMLAFAGTSAPSGLWDRIASELHGEAEPARPVLLPTFAASTTLAALPVARRRRTQTVLAAAAVLALVLGATGAIVSLRSTLHSQQRQLAAATNDLRRRDLNELAAQAASAEGAKAVHLQDAKGTSVADAIVLPTGEAYLVPKSLPVLPGGQTYQLWAVAGASTISAGVLGEAPRTVSFRAPSGVKALALTVEQSPGVAASEQPRFAFAAVAPDAP